MAFGKGGTDDIRSSLPPQTLPPALERCHTSGKARNPPTHTSKTLQGKGGRQGAGMGGQIHVWGRQLPIPLRLCLPKLRAEESRTPRLPAKAPQLRSTLQFSPGWLCSSPIAIPLLFPLLAAFSPRNNPVPSSFPQNTNAFPPPQPADIKYFSTAASRLPQDPHARKLKLPMAGSDYALSVQIAERRRRNILRVLFPGAKAGKGVPTAAPSLPPLGMERGPPPALKAKRSPKKSCPPFSLPSHEEGRVAGSPLPCRAPQVLYPPSSLCQIPNGNQQHIQG